MHAENMINSEICALIFRIANFTDGCGVIPRTDMDETFGVRWSEPPLFKTARVSGWIAIQNSRGESERLEKRQLRLPQSKCRTLRRVRYNQHDKAATNYPIWSIDANAFVFMILPSMILQNHE